jgi:hypothetical protein
MGVSGRATAEGCRMGHEPRAIALRRGRRVHLRAPDRIREYWTKVCAIGLAPGLAATSAGATPARPARSAVGFLDESGVVGAGLELAQHGARWPAHVHARVAEDLEAERVECGRGPRGLDPSGANADRPLAELHRGTTVEGDGRDGVGRTPSSAARRWATSVVVLPGAGATTRTGPGGAVAARWSGPSARRSATTGASTCGVGRASPAVWRQRA